MHVSGWGQPRGVQVGSGGDGFARARLAREQVQTAGAGLGQQVEERRAVGGQDALLERKAPLKNGHPGSPTR